MKLLKTILTIFILMPFLSFGQTTNNPKVNNLLDYINTEFGKYNKFDAHFGVEGNFLVFSNQFGVARIPFKNLDFRVDEKTSSIDVFCTSGEKCINKYDDNGVLSTWDYYNVSLIDGTTMAGSIYTILDKCKQLKSIMTGNVTNDSEDANTLLAYINKQFSKYNKYGSQFGVDKYAQTLIFKNQFGTAEIPFSEIDFRINEEHVSIDVYCLDGSACINKYDDSGELTTWDYYNVSLPDGDGMASEIYTVLEKCKKLKSAITGEVIKDNDKNKDKDESAVLLTYINQQFSKYNKYGSQFGVNKSSNSLIFTNEFGTAEIPFSEIGFRLNEEHVSIDVYCLDGSACINKYDGNGDVTTWDYYNVSLPDGDGMASEIYTVLEKCKKLRTYFVGDIDEEESVEDNSSIDELLAYINTEIKKYNKYGARISVDRENLVFMNDYGRANIPFRSIDFRMNSEHHSIDIYCINGSKCIEKYDNSDSLTSWDYYNISLPDGDGMAKSGTTVLQKCKTLKKKVLK